MMLVAFKSCICARVNLVKHMDEKNITVLKNENSYYPGIAYIFGEIEERSKLYDLNKP
jgi:hypothetical protein